MPWNSKNSVGASRSVVWLWALIARMVRSHRNSLRAIGTPSWMVWMTVATAAAMVGKLTTAALMASGSG